MYNYYHVIQTHATSNAIIGGATYTVKILPDCNSSRSNTEKVNSENRDSIGQLTEEIYNKIVSIHPNPAIDEITVTYTLNEVENAQIRISSYYHKSIYDNYILDVTTQNKTINIYNYPIGVYVVTLVCDGEVADYKVFVKY